MSVNDATRGDLGRDDEYQDTPKGWYARLTMEFDAARQWQEEWRSKGEKIVDRYLDKRKGEKTREKGKSAQAKLNIFTANEQTVAAIMYGNEPEVDVRPRWLDANDEVARLASEIEERVLNGDIEREEDGFQNALALCLNDRRLPGGGFLRARYVCELEQVEAKEAILNDDGTEKAPAVEATERKASEDVETIYVHWRDVLWGPCRIFEEMPWCAFRVQLTKKELVKKFGAKVAAKISLNSKKKETRSDGKKNDPWQRADLWEVWHKDERAVFFFIEGYGEVLKPIDLDDDEAVFNKNGSLKDPLGLDGFWPFPKPMMANLTTSEFLPRADYTLCQDQYEEIDSLTSRIKLLVRAIQAKGVYDKNEKTLARLFEEASENEMLPVAGWQALKERGGIQGAFELMPLEGLIAALDKLCEKRREAMELVQQLDGASDLMRGQSMEPGSTATEQSIKAGYAGVRLQALQKEFARFASDAQRIRAEIIAKHFEPATILERANMGATFDAQNPLVQQALALIKSGKARRRIEVKSDQVSLTDFAARKQEATEVLEAIGGFIQKAAPLVQMVPGALPDLVQLLGYALSKTRGAQEVGGIIDEMKKRAQQAQAPQGQPQPDPKLQEAQLKAQLESKKLQEETQADIVRMKAETREDAVRQQQQTQANIQEAKVRDEMKLQMEQRRPATAPRPPGGMLR